ncbi:sodium channel protein Nach-like [Vanessa atalanta]|uniref:sodium channel protein Nach-like n=1 Tax=Vanessa atalanta TaxID=42275 RepID=UPI001FCD6A3B|nr:sodium channel protein Nach-like [Vanessa atalanta]
MDKFVNEIQYPASMNATYIRSIIKQLSAFASPDARFNVEDLERIEELIDYNNLDIDGVSLRLTPTCEEILLKCQWLGTTVNCSSVFTIEITRVGYCCTFNGRSLKRELKDKRMHDVQTNKEAYYVKDVGFTHSLKVAVHQRHDLSDIDLVYKWLALRPGQNYVDITVNGTPISPGLETWFSYSTRTMQASEEILTLRSDLRGCSLTDQPLKYFPTYHKTYCLMECEMERTLKNCHCLKLAHPRLPGIPVCRARNLICSRDATVSYAIDECDCRATCNVEQEISKISSFELNQHSPTLDSFYDGLDLERVSVVRVFLPNHVERVYQRKSYFTTFNLFSQLGGVFNLFFGCSMLSLLELALLAWRAVRSYR